MSMGWDGTGGGGVEMVGWGLYLSSRVHSQGHKLHRVGRGHGAEVAVADEVESTHCAVQAGSDHHTAAGQEGHCCHRCRVIREGHKAEA